MLALYALAAVGAASLVYAAWDQCTNLLSPLNRWRRRRARRRAMPRARVVRR